MARLESWKEIAGHLERDVRTVQRWEKNEGLPVHRHMHSERGTVYAYTEELDRWSANRSRQAVIGAPAGDAAPRRVWLPFVLAGSAAVLAATAALIWFAIPKRPFIATAKIWAGRLLATTTTEGHKPVF